MASPEFSLSLAAIGGQFRAEFADFLFQKHKDFGGGMKVPLGAQGFQAQGGRGNMIAAKITN